MATPKKKKTSAKKAGKAKPARKVSAKKAHASANARETLLGRNHRERKLSPFTRKQKEKLLQLRDAMVDSMAGVAQDTLRSRAEGSEASAFGMHQADAGSDAYDRDFALSLLSQEQDALYEIDQALKRIELGTYGVCEMSGKPIPQIEPWLERLPYILRTQGGAIANLGPEIALNAGSMPWSHRDPFDRFLAATAMHYGLPLVSADAIFDGVIARIW